MSDDEIYIEENVPIFEAIYGKGLISLGGYEAVDAMFEEMDIQQKHLLDIGFGIGGIPYYLASKYGCSVSGVEMCAWMADYAKSHAPKSINESLQFMNYDPLGKIPLSNESVDLVYSKGVLTNVEDKVPLFNEMARVLKQNGMLNLIDWLAPNNQGATRENLQMGIVSNKETQMSYQNILNIAGFGDITFQDVSQDYLQYVMDYEENLKSPEHQSKYESIISESLREDLIQANLSLKNAILAKKQFSVLIRAKKL